jgi:hypothetical protein
MPTFKNRLDELLADVVLASGIQRQVRLEAVRAYIASTPMDTLKRQIAEITSIPELQVLQAAGVPQALQPTFLFVYSQLTGTLTG